MAYVQRTAYRVILLAGCVGVMLAMHAGGCSDSVPSTDEGGISEARESCELQRQAVEEYVEKWGPLLHEGGFTGVMLSATDDNDGLRIIVEGEIVGDSSEDLSAWPLVIESILSESDPPVEIVNNVEYRLRH